VAGMRVKEIDNDIELFPFINDEDTLSDHENLNQSKNLNEDSKSALDMDDIKFKVKRR
jgi:hypothetical protein